MSPWAIGAVEVAVIRASGFHEPTDIAAAAFAVVSIVGAAVLGHAIGATGVGLAWIVATLMVAGFLWPVHTPASRTRH